MESAGLWIEQCEAARNIEAQFGTPQALEYLVGEKFINFLEAADDHPSLREEIPAFVAEIRSIFERWQPERMAHNDSIIERECQWRTRLRDWCPLTQITAHLCGDWRETGE